MIDEDILPIGKPIVNQYTKQDKLILDIAKIDI